MRPSLFALPGCDELVDDGRVEQADASSCDGDGEFAVFGPVVDGGSVDPCALGDLAESEEGGSGHRKDVTGAASVVNTRREDSFRPL